MKHIYIIRAAQRRAQLVVHWWCYSSFTIRGHNRYQVPYEYVL